MSYRSTQLLILLQKTQSTPKNTLRTMFTMVMLLLNFTFLLSLLPALSAATTMPVCDLGANKCDDTTTSIMICSSYGWKVTETCSQAGFCRVGPAGNAYCDEVAKCIPGLSLCDNANYASKVCNVKGFWETDRKCAKPGCCEVRRGVAACTAECGVGQHPPVARP